MNSSNSKNTSTGLVLIAAAFALSGCVGGSTFGTGVTQEQQLLQDLQGMMSFGSKKRKAPINYSARPDLIVPNQTATLPAPQEQESSTSGANWPESPESRLARIRGDAPEADVRSGELPTGELQREKTGIRIAGKRVGPSDIDRDGHAAIDSLNDGSYKNAKMLKQQYAYSNGPTRKYLTEPPTEYRTPIGADGVGDLGVSEAEKERRALKAAKLKKQEDSGMWTDN